MAVPTLDARAISAQPHLAFPSILLTLCHHSPRIFTISPQSQYDCSIFGLSACCVCFKTLTAAGFCASFLNVSMSSWALRSPHHACYDNHYRTFIDMMFSSLQNSKGLQALGYPGNLIPQGSQFPALTCSRLVRLPNLYTNSASGDGPVMSIPKKS
ncbi:hypothetical protein HDK64DRAFT_275112 [Phyllosticta capitalensis]